MRVPQVGLVLIGIAAFVAGTFFRVQPIDQAAFHRTLNLTVQQHVEAALAASKLPARKDTGTKLESATDCQSKLDALDRTWDLRRDTRRAITLNTNEAWPALVDSTGVYDYFEPEAVCFDDERFGAKATERYKAFGDGPKFVCGVDRIVEKAQKSKDCLIYSVGSNNEIDFEVAITNTMGKGNCEIHTFDPTVKAEAYVGKEYSEFHEWGLGLDGRKKNVNTIRGPSVFEEMSLATAMKRLDHYGKRTIDIFKIDCESCEFIALTAAFRLIAQGEIKINQVQAELHGGASRTSFPMIKELFHAADEAGMRVFHKEPNGWGCKGYACIEYAFVSKEWLREANGYYIC